MYAITSISYRSISQPSDALSGETVVAELPQSLLDSLAQAEATRQANHSNIRSAAEQSLESLRTYRDLASPTNAQTIAVVKLLCRVAIGLIRLQLAKLDGTE